MIDIHSHFLPGIDDGAKSIEESLLMLQNSFDQGITVCVATPHVFLHSSQAVTCFLEKREKSIKLLSGALNKSSEDYPRMVYGAEVFLDNDISVYRGIEHLCITGTNYLLVELSTTKYHPKYHEWLYSLNMKNIVPIIAHIERYSYFDKLMSDLEGVRVVYQINAKTVLSGGGRALLIALCERAERVLIASDMHNMGLRKSCMKKAYDKLKKYYPKLTEDVFITERHFFS